MSVGDELSIYCEIVAIGTTSLTVAAEGIARERNGEATTRVCSGTFKFVLLDNDDKPRAVDVAALSANENVVG
jgi:acyl-CoA thioesterase YciA